MTKTTTRSPFFRTAVAAVVVCVHVNAFAVFSVSGQNRVAGSTLGLSASFDIGYDRLVMADGLDDDGSTAPRRALMSGGSAAISVAYGLHEMLTGYVEASGASVNAAGFSKAGVGHFDFGLRLHLVTRPDELRPFVIVAYTARALVVEDRRYAQDATRTFEFTGSGLTVGAGAQHFFKRNLAMNARAVHTIGKFSTMKTVIERDIVADDKTSESVSRGARTTRVNIGLVWFFLRR